MKLWEKGYNIPAQVPSYTVGTDPRYDRHLLPYDMGGSIAHAATLKRGGYLTAAEFRRLRDALRRSYRRGLRMRKGDEDMHTRIEEELVERLRGRGAESA